jgi:hypothetical protein
MPRGGVGGSARKPSKVERYKENFHINVNYMYKGDEGRGQIKNW